MSTLVVIDPRFNGPAESANGGYACGVLASAIKGPAEVTLRKPPPLGHALRVHRDGARVLLLDGLEVLAEAVPTKADWEVPHPVELDAARTAIAGSPFLAKPRPFPTCFVCGSERDPGDGLRIYPGPLPGREDVHAGPWIPHPSVADDNGIVRPEVVWASLDCPTSGPVGNRPGPDGAVRPIVLGRLAVALRGEVKAGEEHVVMAWRIGADGRKRHAGAALFTARGKLLASARAVWIELKQGHDAPARSTAAVS